jgi:autotransporter-associated beta strand protein
VQTQSAGTNSQVGDITVANAIAKTAGGNATLTLTALHDITFSAGANVTSTVGTLGLTLNASNSINSLQNVSLNGGTLNLNATVSGTQASGTTISGTTVVTKQGAGSFTLSEQNSYSGLTTVSAGTLKLGAAGGATNTPLGTTAAGTTVSSGAVLDLNGFTLGTAEALTLNGTGISSGGALTNSSATGVSYSGPAHAGQREQHRRQRRLHQPHQRRHDHGRDLRTDAGWDGNGLLDHEHHWHDDGHADQAGCGHLDSQRREHLHRWHDDQGWHAVGYNECQRFRQPAGTSPGRYHRQQ